ncbi:MAG TPA: DEAD/DEAH box helicase [Nitrospiraceae bacterium]
MTCIVSKPNKVVLVPFDKVKALWPDAPTLDRNGTRLAVISHDPRSQIRLRAANIEVPAPILSYYDWEKGDPFQVQKTTSALVTSFQRSYVLNDMGTGKTRAALWAWCYLHKARCAGKLLVVAPLSTLKFTWLREVFTIMPDVKAVVLHGSRAKRKELLAQNYQIYIINHDGLKTIADDLHKRLDIDTLILDELAVYRNNSQRSKMMRVFAKRFTWVWGMTGRPMPQAPTDVWAQCKILTPQNVPQYFRHARSLLMTQVSQYKWVPKVNAVDTALSWMQPSVRFALDDVVELPEMISRVSDVEMTEEQTRVYRRLSNEFAVMVNNKRITAANAGVAMNKLLQVGAGYVYTSNPQYVSLDSDPRKDTLLELIEEAPFKLIVFAPWRHLIHGLSELLTKHDIEHATIHGDIPRREQIFHDFQSTPKYRVLLAHPACIHHGVTLTAATTTIWYSPVTSLEIYEQANARIRRIGQKHKQQFFHLQGTAVERKIYSLLSGKQKLQDAFLAMIRTATQKNGES